MSAPEPEIWVVVASYGAPAHLTKEDGSRYGPIVFETNVEGATREAALQRAADAERQDYGPARIARLVFDDQPTTRTTT
jgi:hypothetical protein